MWAKAGWEVMYPSMRTCLGDDEAAVAQFFAELETGKGCDQNWFNGALGRGVSPVFDTDSAPALLGFDEAIASFCMGQPGDENPPRGWERAHAAWCVDAGLNILAVINNGYSLVRRLSRSAEELSGSAHLPRRKADTKSRFRSVRI